VEQGHLAHIYVISQAPPLQQCQLNEGCEEFYSAGVSVLVLSVRCKRVVQSRRYIYTDCGRTVHCFWKFCSCTCHASFVVSVRTVCSFVQMWYFYYCSMKYTYHYTWDKEIIVNSQKLVNRR